MTSKIIFEDLKIYAYHGVLEEERCLGTYFLLNITLEADLWKAAETDVLTDTLNYAAANDIIHREMEIPSMLLEHVSGRMMQALKSAFPQITKIELKLTKTSPPMKGELKGISVAFEKSFS